MRWRRRAFQISAGLAALLLLFLFLWREDRGPSYKGKTLAEWLPAAYNARNPECKVAVEAVRQIGTNGLPFLLKRLEGLNQEDPAWKQKVRVFVIKLLRLRKPQAISLLGYTAEARLDQAVNAFAILDQTATPAIPALTNLLTHSERLGTQARALRALSYIGTNGLAIIAAIVTNTSCASPLRFGALLTIGDSGTNAACVVPTLIDCLNDPEMGLQAARILGNLQLQPALVVPALAKCLHSKDKKRILPVVAAESLAKFGTNAAAAIPDLLQALDSSDWVVRRPATNALLIIAPEVLKKDGH